MKALIYALFAFLILAPATLAIEPELLLSLQGRLTDNNYIPVSDGQHTFQFYFYEASTGGSWIYDSGPLQIVTTQGIWKTDLGLLGSVDFSKQLWVEIKADGQTMSPRVELAHSAYSAASQRLLPTNYKVLFKNYGGGLGIFWNSLASPGSQSHIDTETNGNLWISGGADSSHHVFVEGNDFTVNTNTAGQPPKGAFKITETGNAEFWGGTNAFTGTERPLTIGGMGGGANRFDIATDFVSGSDYGTLLLGSSQPGNAFSLSSIIAQANNFFIQKSGSVFAQFDTVNKVATITGEKLVVQKNPQGDSNAGMVELKNTGNNRVWEITQRASAGDELQFRYFDGASWTLAPAFTLGTNGDVAVNKGQLRVDASSKTTDPLYLLGSTAQNYLAILSNRPQIEFYYSPGNTRADIWTRNVLAENTGDVELRAKTSTGDARLYLEDTGENSQLVLASYGGRNYISSLDRTTPVQNSKDLTIQGFAGPFNLFVIGDITTGTSAQNKRYYAWDGGVKKRVLLEGEGGLTQDYRSYYFNVLGPATTKTYLPPGGYGEVRFTRYVDVNNVVGSENKATATCSVRLKANTTACSGGCKAIYVAVYAPDGSRLCYAGNPDYVNYPPTASTISAVSSTVGSAITTGKYQTFIMYQVPLGTSSIDGWALEDLGADLVLKTYT